MFGRNFAPISSETWAEIDSQVARTLRARLSARRFVDVAGPYGFDYAAVNLGRLRDTSGECCKGTCSGVRSVMPLVESRTWFEISLDELHNVDRGAKDVDFSAAEDAASEAAQFEEKAIYHGFAAAGIKGLAESCVNEPVVVNPNPEQFLSDVLMTARIMEHGNSIEGPYALIGGPALHLALDKTVGGCSIRRALEKEIGITPICSPCFDGMLFASMRGGDFELTLGQDYAVGSAGVCDGKVKFFIVETFTFRVIEPRAHASVKLG